MDEPKTTIVVGHHKPRPYWHVDLKWFFGLLLVVALGVWLLLLNAYNLTSPSVAIPLTTNVLAQMFSHGDLDSDGGVAELKAKVAASPTKSIQPIPDFPVTVTEQDVNTLSPRQLRLKIFGQIAEPLYYKGPHEYAQTLTEDPQKRRQFENDASLLGLVTQSRHELVGRLLIGLGVAAILLLTGVIFFSAGFGRLVTPGVILLVVSVPVAIAFSILKHWADSSIATPANVPAEDNNMILIIAQNNLGGVIAYGQRVYLIGLGVAGGLLLVAAVGKIISLIVASRRSIVPRILQ